MVDGAFLWLEGSHYLNGVSVKDDNIVPPFAKGNINPHIAAIRSGADE